jgi:hypothetical protein
MAISSTRLLNTDGHFAEMKVKNAIGGTTYLNENTTGGGLVIGYEPRKWVANTAYALGQQVVPTVLNGWVYECVAAGTSHAATQPTWPTTSGAVVVDSGVTWRNVSSDSGVYNLYVQLTAAVTEALDDWGYGVWDLEIMDPSANITRLLEGNAILSREVTT